MQAFTARRIQQRLEATIEIPPLADTAQKIIKLRVDPNATIDDITGVVETDPALAAQVVSWAASPYYASPGKIRSVEDAIVRVLGFDLVINLALGLYWWNKGACMVRVGTLAVMNILHVPVGLLMPGSSIITAVSCFSVSAIRKPASSFKKRRQTTFTRNAPVSTKIWVKVVCRRFLKLLAGFLIALTLKQETAVIIEDPGITKIGRASCRERV